MEKLIEMVREKQFLYDKSSPGYKNILLKERTWKEIAKALDIEVTKCKSKWKGLRDSYFREMKKLKNRPSGSAAEELQSKWKYMECMQFLNSIPQVRKTSTNIECAGTSYGTDHDSLDFRLIEMEYEYDESPPSSSAILTTSTPIPPASNSSANCPEDGEFKEFLTNLLSQRTEKEDSVSFFFQNAIEMVRKANLTQLEFIELQMDILAAIKKKMEKKIDTESK